MSRETAYNSGRNQAIAGAPIGLANNRRRNCPCSTKEPVPVAKNGSILHSSPRVQEFTGPPEISEPNKNPGYPQLQIDPAQEQPTDLASHRSKERLTMLLWRCGWVAALLLSCIPYLPAMTGQPIWDDHGLLYGIKSQSPQSLAECFTKPIINTQYFRPVVAISFLMDRQLWHASPFFAHQWNILIHVATTASLIGLLATLFRNRTVAIIGGVLFAIQPAQIMAVAWIGGRTDGLCALWITLFLWSLCSAVCRGSSGSLRYC